MVSTTAVTISRLRAKRRDNLDPSVLLFPATMSGFCSKVFWYGLSALPFLFGQSGAPYGIGFLKKLRLMWKVFLNARQPGSMSKFVEHLTVVSAILSIPASVEGVVAEFGCFKGMSSASLSLACSATGRKLIIFDSFEGLPTPQEEVRNIGERRIIPYTRGQYAGGLDEVRQNVRTFGNINACEFVKGYFEETLQNRKFERYCLIFEDADLPSSVRTVVRHAWPRLEDRCIFFSHEARDLEVMKIFFDDAFWMGVVGSTAPGMVGVGSGLELSAVGSSLGYIRKTGVAGGENSSIQRSDQ